MSVRNSQRASSKVAIKPIAADKKSSRQGIFVQPDITPLFGKDKTLNEK